MQVSSTDSATQPNIDMSNWLTYEEASEFLERSLQSVRHAAHIGVLHPKKLPRIKTKLKYLHRNEVEWFKGRELTLKNAELYKEYQNSAFPELARKLRPFEEVINSLSTSDLLDFMQMLLSVIYTFGISHTDDAATKDELRQTLLEYIKSTEQTEVENEGLKKLAHAFTEKLSQKNLSFAERKVYRELLDATLTAIATDSSGYQSAS